VGLIHQFKDFKSMFKEKGKEREKGEEEAGGKSL
jgi:hypothetical protein